MASEADPLAPLKAALSDLIAWCKASQVPTVIIGGVAAAILGRPRVTRDVDALVWLAEESWDTFAQNGLKLGFRPRVSDAVGFAKKSRVLLMRHETTAVDIDIAFGALPFERETLDRSVLVSFSGLTLPLPTVEDLVIMKLVACRPRDIADVEGILSMHSSVDVVRIRRCVSDFAALLERPEIMTQLEAQLANRP